MGYLYNGNKFKLLNIMLSDGQIKWMYFLIEDHKLLQKYNTICNNVSADIKKNLITRLSIIKII